MKMRSLIVRASIAAATRSACTVSATSCARMMAAPFAAASRWLAIEPPMPFIGRRGRHRIDETLARGADQKRQAEPFEFGQLGNAQQALLRRLAEADAGIEHDAVARDAGARGNLQRALEERRHVGDDVDAPDRRSRGYA